MAEKKPFVASYSKLKTASDCPRKFYHLEIAKDVAYDPMGAEGAEGDKVHKRLETCIKSGLDAPHSARHAQWALDLVRKNIIYDDPVLYRGPKSTILTECKFGLNARLERTEYFGPDVKFRGIADLAIIVPDGTHGWLYDYKNGKPGYADPEQLDIMAMCLFIYFPKLQSLEAQLLFLKHPDELMHKEEYDRGDLNFLKGNLVSKVRTIAQRNATNDWPPHQSGLCKKYCPVPKTMCNYSGKGG